MSKFIVALDNGTREQQNAITAMLQSKGWDLWHHMEDFWLLANVPDTFTPRNLWEEFSANPMIEPRTLIVMKISGGNITYWGRAPKDAWTWLAKFWGNAG